MGMCVWRAVRFDRYDRFQSVEIQIDQKLINPLWLDQAAAFFTDLLLMPQVI